jgi:hypothetical protein
VTIYGTKVKKIYTTAVFSIEYLEIKAKVSFVFPDLISDHCGTDLETKFFLLFNSPDFKIVVSTDSFHQTKALCEHSPWLRAHT